MAPLNEIRKRPLIFYVILNYLISWTFLYPCYQIILNADEGSFPWLALIGIPGGFGPSLAAIITVWLTEGKAAVQLLMAKFKSFKVNVKWYLLILILPIVIYLAALLITNLFGFELGNINVREGLKMIFPYFLLALPFGPVMEELGWRGYMLPALLKKYNIYISSLILGITWTFWHIASFTFPGAAIPSVFEVSTLTVVLYLLSITAETFIISYFYLRTNGSLIIAILFHASFNASSNIILSVFPDVEENVEFRLLLFVINIILMSLTAFFLFSRLKRSQKVVS